jgi:hypothetical protein
VPSVIVILGLLESIEDCNWEIGRRSFADVLEDIFKAIFEELVGILTDEWVGDKLVFFRGDHCG